MASLTILDNFRQIIGDVAVHTFNEAVSDGINASWVLTNKPVVRASDSLFLDGELQQNGTSTGILNASLEIGGKSATLSLPNSFVVGDQVAFENVVDPFKFELLAINNSSGVVQLNRESEKAYASGSTVYKIVKDYTIDYTNGIVFFDEAPLVDVKLNVRFRYTKYSDSYLSNFISQASDEVAIDINEVVNIDSNPSHKVLVFLKAYGYLLNEQVTKGASSAIKIKTGNTSLDLVGSTTALKDQLRSMTGNYSLALKRYLHGLVAGELGGGVTGLVNTAVAGG